MLLLTYFLKITFLSLVGFIFNSYILLAIVIYVLNQELTFEI